ncbi:hypothetical protein [Streptococcus thermophilus]|uniref:hypothetical protein n=1 Tax=Streptococcus thermophilus TaxID=1308 RepID=UPI0003EEE6AB|nr:hypothetical protein [Streptococcus thermophilus]EWM59067.1 hypothetical protein Y018_04435 [Streptococcus thermophilus TH982]
MKLVLNRDRIFGVKLVYLFITSMFLIISFLFPTYAIDSLAILLVITNLFTIFLARKNQISLFISFILLFFNLSIALSDYTFHINQITWNSLVYYNNGQYYQEALIMLLVFNIVFLLTINTDEYIYQPIAMQKESPILFWVFYLITILILIFGINRNAIGIGYEVRITPIFEYSIVFFLMCHIFSNKSNAFHSSLIIILAILYILQDAMYGGRITSIQLFIFLSFNYFSKVINVKNLIIFFTFAILVFTFIGRHRGGDSLSMSSLFEGFVNDTATFAYGSSTTHLFAADQIDWNTRLMSLFYFIVSFILPLPKEASILSNVTAYSQHFHVNIGGGVVFSHLYFWGGYPLLLLFAIIFNLYLNKIEKSVKSLDRGILLLLISYFPRLYLYSPKAGLRSSLVLFPLLWLLFSRLDIGTGTGYLATRSHPSQQK